MPTAIEAHTNLTPSLFDAAAEVEHVEEPTTPAARAKQRVDETLDYLTKYNAAPKRAQIVRMLRELSDDLGKHA